MQFKGFTALRILSRDSKKLLRHDAINYKIYCASEMDHTPFISAPPDATSWLRYGFAPFNGESEFVYDGASFRIFRVEKQERLLPGKVIKQAIRERLKDIEERDGVKPNRKIIAQVRDEVTSELLPKAFIKVSQIHVLVLDDYLLIETTSAKQCDNIIGFLGQFFATEEIVDVEDESEPLVSGALQLSLLAYSNNPTAWLGKIALSDWVEHFRCGNSCVIATKEGVVRVRDMDLNNDNVHELITDGWVKELALGFVKGGREEDDEEKANDVEFVLTESMTFKRLKFADIHLKEINDISVEDETARNAAMFDANVILLAGYLSPLLKRVDKATRVEDEEL